MCFCKQNGGNQKGGGLVFVLPAPQPARFCAGRQGPVPLEQFLVLVGSMRNWETCRCKCAATTADRTRKN